MVLPQGRSQMFSRTRSLFGNLVSAMTSRRPKARRCALPLALEALEDRILPSANPLTSIVSGPIADSRVVADDSPVFRISVSESTPTSVSRLALVPDDGVSPSQSSEIADPRIARFLDGRLVPSF